MNQEILRKKKKYFYLYKITNNINNKFYYGIHCTNNLEDNYIGSGKLLNKAYKKYGIENFKKEIIKFCNSLEKVSILEKQIVNKDLLNNPLCYNLILGGYYLDEETLNHIGKLNSKNQKGKNNSQFGTKWINDGESNIKVKLENLEIYLNNGWKLGRFIKNTNNIKNANQNRCWVFKDNKSYHINKNDLQKYLNNGYIQGRTKNGIKKYIPHPETKFSRKGKIFVKDKKGNKIGFVSINDPKYLSGEYISIREYNGTPNKVICKDKNGNIFSIDKNDKRLKTKELVGINKGKKWKQKGKDHFKGYKWMIKDNIRTRVSSDKFEEYLNNGYKFGYKIN